ncbi:MAG: hypothetical protein P8Y44_07115 [Acidobacteriota bacterium]
MNGSPGRLPIVPLFLVLMAPGFHPASGDDSRQTEIAPIEIVETLVAQESGNASGEVGERARLYLDSVLGPQCGAETEMVSTDRAGAISAVWRGTQDSEIILSAHCDSVAEGAAAVEEVSGCGLVAAVGCRLAQTPRHHPLRAIFFTAEGEPGIGELGMEQRTEFRRTHVAAVVFAEHVGSRNADIGVLLPIATEREGRWRSTPVWLVHAALEGARAAGLPLVIADSRWPVFAQLSLRISRPARIFEGRSFAVAGVPAVAVSDVSLTESPHIRQEIDAGKRSVDSARLDLWTEALSAMIVHMDQAGQGALSDSEYLVAFRRTWIRRDLLWLGFILWVPMVFRGLPGSWRGTSSASRRRMGRDYLPGFAFRMLFLLSMFLIPTLATVLLYPAAILALIPVPTRASWRYLIGSLAFLPLLAFSVWLSLAHIGGYLALHRGALLPAALILLSLSTFWLWRVDQRPFHLA